MNSDSLPTESPKVTASNDSALARRKKMDHRSTMAQVPIGVVIPISLEPELL